MADNDLKAPLADVDSKDSVSTIVPLLFLVVTGSGMCISGLGYALENFNARSVLTGIIFLFVLSATYWWNASSIIKACHSQLKLSKNEPYSYSRLIKAIWGRKRGLTIQILMAIHNIIILTYLQQRIAANAYRIFHTGETDAEGNTIVPVPSYTDTFYYIALANIPLILLALQNKYSQVKYFAILSILVWIYLFVGVMTEAADTKEGITSTITKTYKSTFLPEMDESFVVTIGLLAYFMSYFQIIPYVYTQVESRATMDSVLSKGAIGLIIMVGSVMLYFLFPFNESLNVIRYSGVVIIGSCVMIINVLPTREFIVQVLDENAKEKQQTRDRFITLLLLSITLILSIFISTYGNWQVFIGLGTILTGLLGFVFPAVVYYEVADKHSEKNKMILGLVWNSLLGAVVVVAGVFMMIVKEKTGRF